MYRAAVEWLLGFRLRGRLLRLEPCIPRAWEGCRIRYRYHSARYEIEVENPNRVCRVMSERVALASKCRGKGDGKVNAGAALARLWRPRQRGDPDGSARHV